MRFAIIVWVLCAGVARANNYEGFARRNSKIQKPTQDLNDGQISFTAYQDYNTIEKYIKRLSKEYPDIVTLESIGRTYEKRQMWLLKIGRRGKNKPVILIDGGIHAREWISPAVVLYTIQSLVENKNNRNLIENVDWYIIPVLNPDGYEYSLKKDPWWRKNRAPTSNPSCPGTDLNRNFPYKWNRIDDICNDTYSGKYPSDQLETRNFQTIVLKYKEHIKLYVSFHSVRKAILLPWGYTTMRPKDHVVLYKLASNVKDAIFAVNGTEYSIGSPKETVNYTASGGSFDWVKGAVGIELSYVIELPGRGRMDFFPPNSMILGICVETFEGSRAFHNYIEKTFVTKEQL